MAEERRIQLAAEVDTTRTREGFQEIGQQATTMAATVTAAGERAGRAAAGIGDGADRGARRVEVVQRSMINSIERATAAYEAGARSGSRYFEVLARQRGVDPAILEPYLAQLRAVEAAQTRTNGALGTAPAAFHAVGVSAAQTAAALRGVPAQLTDIVTSLQGGQAPLTVFLQQGGQLRDMFGSAGGAARALGSYVVSLITPLNLAAAAVVALGVAYHQGAQEAVAYNKALILSGNAAGTTADQLADMASSISKSVGTQGAAAEALAALAGTGRVSVANLQRFGQTAVSVEKAIGQSAADTAAIFAELGDAPLKASEKLNQQYRYLTAAIYDQISALMDQGRVQEAGEVAQKAYSDAMDGRSSKLIANLGYAERAWNSIASVAKGAWDAMLGVGRADTLQEQLTKAEARVKSSAKNRFGFIGAGEYREAQSDVDRLKAQIDAEAKLAAIEAGRVALEQAKIVWSKEGEQYLTRELQLKKDIALVQQQGTAAGASDAEIAARVGEVRKKYAEVAFKSINDQIDAIERRGNIEEEVAKRSAMAVAAARAAGIATSLAAQISYAEQVEASDQAALKREKDRIQQRIALQKQLPDSPENRKTLADLRAKSDLVEEQSLTRKAQLKNDIYELDVKDSRQAAASLTALAGKRDAELAGLRNQVQAQKDANAQIGMSQQGVSAFSAALLEEAAARKEVEAAILDTIVGREQEAEKLNSSAAALRELAAAQREGVLKAAVFEEQKQFWTSVERTAHDTFVSIMDGSKSAAQRLKDSFKNIFFDWLYQMTLKKWIVNVSGGVLPTSGVGGAAQAFSGAGQAVGGASSAIQAASSASSLYGLVTGGMAGIGSKIGSLGSSIGSTIVADFGAGLSGQAAAAAQAYGHLAGATSMSTAASAGASINAAIAAIPGWGWAIVGAAAAAKVFGLFDGKGPEKNTRLTFNSNNTPGNISINERGNEGKVGQSYIDGSSTGAFGSFGLSSTFWSDGFSETVQSFIKTVTKVDDVLAGYLTDSEKAAATAAVTGKAITANLGAQGTNQNANGELDGVFAARLNAIFDSLSPGMSSLITGFKGTAQELATESAALLEYRQALKASGEAVFGAKVTLQDLAALKAPSEATSAALNRITKEFAATNTVAAALGKTAVEAFGAAGLASLGAREQLITLSGGMDALAASTGGFAQNYLSEAERLAPVTKAVEAAMAELGLSSVKTREQFKQQVQGLDLTTEAGAKQYVALMQLQEAFAQVYPAIEATTAAMDGAAARAADIAAERAGLQKQYDQAFMSDSEKARAAINSANLALYDSVQARLAEKAAIDAAAQAAIDAVEARAAAEKASAEKLSSVNAGYQQQIDSILRARMDEAAGRAFDIKGLDASTVALYDHLKALQAEDKAATAAAEAITKAQQSAAATEAARLTALQTARSALAQAYDRESSALQQVIEKARESAKALRAYGDSLRLGNLSTLAPEEKYAEARRQFVNATPEQLQGASTAFLEASRAFNSNNEAYNRDYLMVQEAISRSAQAADGQVAAAQAQLGYLAQQVAGIAEVNKSVLSVAAALAGYKAAAAVVPVSAGGTGAAVPSVLKPGYLAETTSGWTNTDWAYVLKQAKGINGSHKNGLWSVPGDGYVAELHDREAVLTAPQADRWRAGQSGGDSAEVAELLQKAVDVLAKVEGQLQAANTQRGAIALAQLRQGDVVAQKLDKTARKLEANS